MDPGSAMDTETGYGLPSTGEKARLLIGQLTDSEILLVEFWLML